MYLTLCVHLFTYQFQLAIPALPWFFSVQLLRPFSHRFGRVGPPCPSPVKRCPSRSPVIVPFTHSMPFPGSLLAKILEYSRNLSRQSGFRGPLPSLDRIPCPSPVRAKVRNFCPGFWTLSMPFPGYCAALSRLFPCCSPVIVPLCGEVQIALHEHFLMLVSFLWTNVSV